MSLKTNQNTDALRQYQNANAMQPKVSEKVLQNLKNGAKVNSESANVKEDSPVKLSISKEGQAAVDKIRNVASAANSENKANPVPPTQGTSTKIGENIRRVSLDPAQASTIKSPEAATDAMKALKDMIMKQDNNAIAAQANQAPKNVMQLLL